MGDILVFCEQHDGVVGASSLGLLEEAAKLASGLGAQVDAVVCGEGLDDAAMAALGGHGARTVYVADADELAQSLPQPMVDAIAGVVAAHPHDIVLLSASVLASDVGAALAARLGTGLIVDTIELHAENGRLVTRRPGLGDSVLAHCALAGDRGVIVARANTYAPSEDAAAGAAQVERVAVATQSWSSAARVVGHEAAEASAVDISEADVLVAGGRGLGGPENFALCEELAKALGGEVAATRAVVDAGWYPYAAQVGQTGKTVSPRLYVACGISGAIQHKVGMAGAETIVAINKDANAPIFDFCDLGVVGDVHQVLPRLTELVRAQRHA
jgi:electron transfer flavoprotein alpha subunit